MNENNRWTKVSGQYIRDLFAATRDGKLAIIYYDSFGAGEPLTHPMEWTAADAEDVARRYDSLVRILTRFGELHDALQDPARREQLLSPEERTVWETYLAPFEPFEVEEAVVGELFMRGEFDQLSEEENALLERYGEWRDRESLKRLPYRGRSPADVLLRARRYERLVSLNASAALINDEARCLAEEMVLYYGGKKGAY